jgi:hypothetical protein
VTLDLLRRPESPFPHRPGGRRDWGWFLILLGLLAGLYGLLINPYWVMAGDGETYLGIARELAQGNGFKHNGQPVGLIPPGWPILLAGGMHLTDQMWALKLIPAAMGIGFFGTCFWILRRYTTPGLATAACLTVGAAYPTVRLSFWFFSDLPFCFFFALALLLAHRIAETRVGWQPSAWRRFGEPIVLCLMVAAAVSVRWNGVLLPAILGAVLVSGQPLWRPRLDLTWATAFLAAGVGFATFFALRAVMAVDPAEVDPRYPLHLVRRYDYINQYEGAYTLELIKGRVELFGRWFAGMLWDPFWHARGTMRTLGNLLGWIALVSAAAMAAREAWHRRYWLLGGFVMWLPVAITWPHPMARYLLPLGPLLVAGAVLGVPVIARAVTWSVMGERVGRIASPGDRRSAIDGVRRLGRRVGILAGSVFFAGTILLNAPLLALEVYVQQSRPFYATTLGGAHRHLQAVGKHLATNGSDGDEIGVTYIRFRNGRYLKRLGWAWAINWLTDRPVQVIPARLSVNPLDRRRGPKLIEYMQERGIRWYVWQPPYGYYYHFPAGGWSMWLLDGRDPRRLDEVWTNQPRRLARQDWQLWELVGDELVRVEVEPVEDWPRVVPRLHENPTGPPYRGIPDRSHIDTDPARAKTATKNP